MAIRPLIIKPGLIFDTLTSMAMRGRIVAVVAIICVSGASYYALKNRKAVVKPPDVPHPPILVVGVNEPDELRVEPFPLPALTPPEQEFADQLRKPTAPNTKFDVLAMIN